MASCKFYTSECTNGFPWCIPQESYCLDKSQSIEQHLSIITIGWLVKKVLGHRRWNIKIYESLKSKSFRTFYIFWYLTSIKFYILGVLGVVYISLVIQFCTFPQFYELYMFLSKVNHMFKKVQLNYYKAI